MPPAALKPTRPPASWITASRAAAASSVAPTSALPVEVLRKSTPAITAARAAAVITAGSRRLPVSRISFSVVPGPGGGPAGLDQLADQADIAVQDRRDRRHHVDLVGTGRDRGRGLLRRRRDVVAAVREVGDRGEAHRAAVEVRAGERHVLRIDADGGRAVAHGALTQALDLGRRLAAAEAGEVDQRHGPRREAGGDGRLARPLEQRAQIRRGHGRSAARLPPTGSRRVLPPRAECFSVSA